MSNLVRMLIVRVIELLTNAKRIHFLIFSDTEHNSNSLDYWLVRRIEQSFYLLLFSRPYLPNLLQVSNKSCLLSLFSHFQ